MDHQALGVRFRAPELFHRRWIGQAALAVMVVGQPQPEMWRGAAAVELMAAGLAAHLITAVLAVLQTQQARRQVAAAVAALQAALVVLAELSSLAGNLLI